MEPNEGIEVPGESEQVARTMGWVPEEDFRGDKDKWVSADKFVERGKNELPIMRERITKVTNDNVGLRNELKSVKKSVKEFHEFQKGAEKRAYERAVKDLTEKQREAVSVGDDKAFDKIEDEKTALQKEHIESIESTPSTEGEEEFNEWVADNQWFKNDPELGNYAIGMADFIQNQKGLKGVALYNEAKKETELRFPERFGKTVTPTAPIVEGDSAPAPKSGKKTFANLPDEAKQACKNFMRDIPGYTEKEYLKDYEW